LADDISSGRLSADTKLPTQRELADKLGVALGTITRAYAEAERRGLVRAEGRRGTFVGEPQTSRTYLTKMADLQARGIDLSKNHPFYQLDPDLSRTLKQIARGRTTADLLEYPPAAGFQRHRETGAQWLSGMGAKVDAESVFVAAGAQHAMSVILANEVRPGDVIASENYTYPGIKALAEQYGLHLIGVPTDRLGLIPEALEALCRQRQVRLLYCNPTLTNPTTTITPTRRREQLAEVIARHGLTVIEDEIMQPMMTEHPNYLYNMLPDNCYLVVSASKAVAAGLRLGFLAVPPLARRGMVSSLNASCLGVAPLVAEIFSMWWQDGTVDRIIADRRVETAARQKLAAEVLSLFSFAGHPNCYHIWLRLPEQWSGLRLAMEAQLRGVIITPAEAFAADGKSHLAAVRMSIAVPPTMDLLKEGLETIAGLVGGQTGHSMATV
jgi:DNA-binding transcriptional MocR family regulator